MKKDGRSKTISVQYSTRVKTGNDGPFRYGRHVQRPRITMEGIWLEKLGFHIGDRLEVDYGDGFLYIRLAGTGMQPGMVCEDTGKYYAVRERDERSCGNPDVKEAV